MRENWDCSNISDTYLLKWNGTRGIWKKVYEAKSNIDRLCLCVYIREIDRERDWEGERETYKQRDWQAQR